LSTLPSSIGNLSKLTTLHLGYNPLRIIPDTLGNVTCIERVYNDDNHTIYPPSGLDEEKTAEYIRNNLDVISVEGRTRHAWPGIRLMCIAQRDAGCIATFGKLPIELINVIRQYILYDPYFTTPQ
jgi:hypothetical protein